MPIAPSRWDSEYPTRGRFRRGAFRVDDLDDEVGGVWVCGCAGNSSRVGRFGGPQKRRTAKKENAFALSNPQKKLGGPVKPSFGLSGVHLHSVCNLQRATLCDGLFHASQLWA